jgi:cyclopropane-fatty-acyl-phospholipid synthase
MDRLLGLFNAALAEYRPRDFAVKLWTGEQLAPNAPETSFTLAINTTRALKQLLFRPTMLGLGECYVGGELDIEGDIRSAFRLADYFLNRRTSWMASLRGALSSTWTKSSGSGVVRTAEHRARLRGRRSQPQRVERAVTFHYDLPSEFFSTFLDAQMVYSCAYFAEPNYSLDQAQIAKLEYVCRKLELTPGRRLLDVGCGWGALLEHAARRYGVNAVGYTLSGSQAEYARNRLRGAPEAERCRVVTADFRQIDREHRFDAIASVGMAEHVAREALVDYFRLLHSILTPGGLVLHHAIGSTMFRPLRGGPSFMDRHVFPDSDIVTIGSTIAAAEAACFEVRDVENLREHYATTVARWLDRFEANADQIRAQWGERLYRTFRIYLAGSQFDLERGRLAIYQSLLRRPTDAGGCEPRTRAHLYR